MLRLAMLTVGCAAFLGCASGASATSFCNVLKSPDGFVALRAAPDIKARIVARMKEDDEVQLLDGRKGQWREVLHWHGDQRLQDATRGNTRRGWMSARYMSECG